MDGWVKLLANKVHIQGMEVLLADIMHKQEPQCKWLYISHNHTYISSNGITYATFYSYFWDGCVKRKAIYCGSCLCTMSTSNTSM